MKKSKLVCNVMLAVLLGVSLTGCAIKQDQERVGEYVDGGVATATIKSKMLADPALKNTIITVTTYQDTVQLSGFVNTAYQKDHAAQVAIQTKGVKRVVNSLVIKK